MLRKIRTHDIYVGKLTELGENVKCVLVKWIEIKKQKEERNKRRRKKMMRNNRIHLCDVFNWVYFVNSNN